MDFSIYKKGQGTAVRLVAAGIGLIFAYFTGNEVFVFLNKFFLVSRNAAAVCGALAFLVVVGFIVEYVLRRARSVDYLIETEIEMRKVNWPSRKEVVSSTGVVIATVTVLSIYIYLNDLVIFKLLDVLDIFSKH